MIYQSESVHRFARYHVSAIEICNTFWFKTYSIAFQAKNSVRNTSIYNQSVLHVSHVAHTT